MIEIVPEDPITEIVTENGIITVIVMEERITEVEMEGDILRHPIITSRAIVMIIAGNGTVSMWQVKRPVL